MTLLVPDVPPILIDGPRGKRVLPPQNYRNIAVTLSYVGSAFSGYQYQPHACSVQESILQAWKLLTGENVFLQGCSRLDAGVDAHHYVANIFTASDLSNQRILQALNGIFLHHLRLPISVYAIEEKSPEFHARYDAVGKHYRYLMWYGWGRHAMWTPRCWLLKGQLDFTAFADGVNCFEGTHDFAAFRSQDCGAKTTQRTIHKVRLCQNDELKEIWILDVWGDGFLKNMIRNIVGTCVDLAKGKFSVADVKAAFVHGDRTQVGQCAPAHGLSLQKVFYSQEEYIYGYSKHKK